MNKQTAVEWLVKEINKLDMHINDLQHDIALDIIDQAKEMEHAQQEDVLKWRESMFTKDAPIEYILREFSKLKNK